MAGLEPNEVIAYFQIGHAHHPLHQVLPMGIKPFASLQRFDQQIEQLNWWLCWSWFSVLLASCSISIGKT